MVFQSVTPRLNSFERLNDESFPAPLALGRRGYFELGFAVQWKMALSRIERVGVAALAKKRLICYKKMACLRFYCIHWLTILPLDN